MFGLFNVVMLIPVDSVTIHSNTPVRRHSLDVGNIERLIDG